MFSSQIQRTTAPLRATTCKTVGVQQRPQASCKKSRVSHTTQALQIDWLDEDTWVNLFAGIFGLAGGYFGPYFIKQVVQQDEDRIEEIRELNRATFRATGQYMSEEELQQLRPTKWTDRREFVDDD